MAMMKPLCCLNGLVQPVAEARVDPLDRGFLFGDALYDVVRVVEGSLLHLDAHLARLRGGLERIDIAVRFSEDERKNLAAVLAAHPTLQSGAQLHRYSQGAAGIYAFSRIDNHQSRVDCGQHTISVLREICVARGIQ